MNRGLQYLVAGAMALGMGGSAKADDVKVKEWPAGEQVRIIEDIAKDIRENHPTFSYIINASPTTSTIAINRNENPDADGIDREYDVFVSAYNFQNKDNVDDKISFTVRQINGKPDFTTIPHPIEKWNENKMYKFDPHSTPRMKNASEQANLTHTTAGVSKYNGSTYFAPPQTRPDRRPDKNP